MGNRLLLIVNPVAGKGRIKSYTYEIINKLEEYGWIVTVHRTTKNGDATEFVEKYATEFDRVVCCGGDGTLSEVISGLMKMASSSIPLGYIASGTTNDLAESLGLPKNILKAAELAAYGVPQPLDVGNFNHERYFSYVASFGAFTKVSYATSQSVKNIFGHLAYVLAGIGSIGDIQEQYVKITGENIDLSGEYIFGAVCNSLSVAGIVRLPEDRVSLNDGLFEAVFVKKPKDLVGIGNLVQAITSRKFDSEYLEFFSARELRIEFDRPTAFTLDGEFGGEHSTVEVKNEFRALNFIR